MLRLWVMILKPTSIATDDKQNSAKGYDLLRERSPVPHKECIAMASEVSINLVVM